MDRFYYSIYGPFIQEFLDLKRSLGYKYKDADWVFTSFDNFAMHREDASVEITKELADEWCSMSPNESEKSRYNRVQIIRQFSLFLCQIGYPSHIPKLPKFKSVFIPHIFSTEEVNVIFTTCDHLRVTRSHPNSAVFSIPVLFRLLYGTGIRISEALFLSLEDVNLEKQNLILRNCKNGKDRLVPISDSLSEVCSSYLNYRNQISLLAYSIANNFFLHPDGSALNVKIAYQWFRKVLDIAGISHGGRGIGPRLHDLRHTFSVHSLASMAEMGLDLYYSLPILSTYLGHQSLAATDKYVRLTAEMYPSIIDKANNLYPYLFPEIYNLKENETN